MFFIEKRFGFEAHHELPLLPDGHKCRRPHGHSFKVVLRIAFKTTDERGFAGGLDFADLKSFRHYLDTLFDHRSLNARLGDMATSEMLAKHLFQWAKEAWPSVDCVRVSETSGTWVEYRE
jgi:6-pyruvoyltetrahydropterin/6-carboxytetrahydropterin synthase